LLSEMIERFEARAARVAAKLLIARSPGRRPRD
jgi:hypothetical protein